MKDGVIICGNTMASENTVGLETDCQLRSYPLFTSLNGE